MEREIGDGAGQKIYNPVTGQRMRFLATATETEGSLLRIETVNTPCLRRWRDCAG
jgi:hypothetical protein